MNEAENRRMQEEKNQNVLRLLSMAFEFAASTIVITNGSGVIEFVNPAFSKITGFSKEEAIGNKPSVLKSAYHPSDYYDKLWRTILSGKVWKGEFYNRRKDGTHYWESAIITPIFDRSTGYITHFVAIKEDISQTKYYLEELVKSERKLSELNATKDKFFSIISHDLKNPIGAIYGLSELLIHTLTPENKGYAFAIAIPESVLRIDKLLQNLLIWTQTQSNQIKPVFIPVRIEILMNDVMLFVDPIARNKKINLSWQVDGNVIAEIDLNMISSVLQNLITNAIKFTVQGGEVRISFYTENNNLIFKVADTGIGMQQQQLQSLFKPENAISTPGTENETGTGLGLIISKEFVEKHGGKIWATSIWGKGSTFYFTIPAEAKQLFSEQSGNLNA